MTTQTAISPAILNDIDLSGARGALAAAILQNAHREAILLVEAAEEAIREGFDEEVLAEIRGCGFCWQWLELAEA